MSEQTHQQATDKAAVSFPAVMNMQQVAQAVQTEKEYLGRKVAFLSALTRNSEELTQSALNHPEGFNALLDEVEEYRQHRANELAMVESTLARLMLAGGQANG